MSNLELAFAALSLVRDRISLASSDNKRFDDPDPETLDKAGKERYMSRYINHMNKLQHITNMRNHKRNPQKSGGSILNINNYGAYALAAGAGNCLEMSCATAWYLNQQGKFHYALIHYGDGGDPTRATTYSWRSGSPPPATANTPRISPTGLPMRRSAMYGPTSRHLLGTTLSAGAHECRTSR